MAVFDDFVKNEPVGPSNGPTDYAIGSNLANLLGGEWSIAEQEHDDTIDGRIY
jgi:hypothetical protein